jgi:hypothetical protein
VLAVFWLSLGRGSREAGRTHTHSLRLPVLSSNRAPIHNTHAHMQEAELTNARWAMAAVAGILFTDLLGKGNWWEAGAQTYWLDNQTLVCALRSG